MSNIDVNKRINRDKKKRQKKLDWPCNTSTVAVLEHLVRGDSIVSFLNLQSFIYYQLLLQSRTREGGGKINLGVSNGEG